MKYENKTTDTDVDLMEKALSDYARSYPIGKLKQDMPRVYSWVVRGRE